MRQYGERANVRTRWITFTALSEFFSQKQDLQGLNVPNTAGPTREAIDPVRYISNHSSGKWDLRLLKHLPNVGQTSH